MSRFVFRRAGRIHCGLCACPQCRAVGRPGRQRIACGCGSQRENPTCGDSALVLRRDARLVEPCSNTANICVMGKYPGSDLGLPFSNVHMPRPREALSRRLNDEDDLPSGGAHAGAISCDSGLCSCANRQRQRSNACRHRTDNRQRTARIRDRRSSDRGSAVEFGLHERHRLTTMRRAHVGLWQPRLCRAVQECILTSPRGGRCDGLGCPWVATGNLRQLKGPLRGSQFGAGQSGRGK